MIQIVDQAARSLNLLTAELLCMVFLPVKDTRRMVRRAIGSL